MRLKRLAFSLVLALVVWAVAEVAALLLLSATDRAWAWPSRLAAARAKAGEEAAARVGGEIEGESHENKGLMFPEQVIHPFLGFVLDPYVKQGLAVTNEGFSRIRSEPPPKEQPRFTVGLFGG